MDDLSVRNKNTVATVATSTKSGKTGQSNSADFASFLVFGTGNMNNTMSMNTSSQQNDAVYDEGGNGGYDHSSRDNRETRTDHSRDDEAVRDRSNDNDYRRDDAPQRDNVAADDRQDSGQSNRDEHQNADNAPRDEHAGKDDASSQENASSDQSQSASANNNETSSDAQGQTNQNTTTENVSNQMAQVAADTFAQGADTQTQTTTDPAAVVAAGQQQTNTQTKQAAQTPQSVQNIDANAGSNKDLFSNGWQNNAGQNGAQNANNQAQGQQQTQAGGMNQQGVDPQLQGQLSSEAQKQAADLSKKVGANQRAQVNVNVTNQGTDTSSTMSQNLSNAAQVATEASNPSAAGKQSNQKAGANGQAQNVQVAAANGQTQNVQQNNNNQNNQNQSFQNMVGDVKGAAKTQTMQQPQSVNPEATQTAAASNTNKAQTTQQTTETKNVFHHKPEVHTTAKPEEISVEISKAAKAGADRINIQLKPLELGRIEVQLEMAGGKVVTTIIAERPETLQMLKNDASDLAKSLTEAGLNMGDMNFNLQHENKQGQQTADGAKGGAAADQNVAQSADEELLLASDMEMLAQRAQERAAARGGIDLNA